MGWQQASWHNRPPASAAVERAAERSQRELEDAAIMLDYAETGSAVRTWWRAMWRSRVFRVMALLALVHVVIALGGCAAPPQVAALMGGAAAADASAAPCGPMNTMVCVLGACDVVEGVHNPVVPTSVDADVKGASVLP